MLQQLPSGVHYLAMDLEEGGHTIFVGPMNGYPILYGCSPEVFNIRMGTSSIDG